MCFAVCQLLLLCKHSAPQLVISGTATLGDGKGKRTVRGTAWMEHQWGNFRGYSNLHSRYQWAWARLDNGDLITYRQWHAQDAQDKGEPLSHSAVLAALHCFESNF